MNNLKYLYQTLLSILTVVLQTTLMPVIAIGGVRPNLILSYVVASAAIGGSAAGVCAGTLCGIFLDVTASSYFGFNSIIYLFVGFISGIVFEDYIKSKVSTIVISIGVIDFLFGIVCYIYKLLSLESYNFFICLWKIIIPEAVYTLLICIPIMVILDRKIFKLY